MKQEMLAHQEDQLAQDGQISELKAMVQTLMEQIKGKGKASEPTPEEAGAGGGNPPPLRRRRAAGAPGGDGEGDSDDEGEGYGRKPDESKKGRRDERPAPQPENNNDAEDKQQFNLFSRVMANALGQRTRVPGAPPAMCRNEKHQDIHMRLVKCRDYFRRNSWQWQDEA